MAVRKRPPGGNRAPQSEQSGRGALIDPFDKEYQRIGRSNRYRNPTRNMTVGVKTRKDYGSDEANYEKREGNTMARRRRKPGPPGGYRPPQSEQEGRGVLKKGPANAMSARHGQWYRPENIDPVTGAQKTGRLAPGGNRAPQSEQSGRGVLKRGPASAASAYHGQRHSAFKIDPRTGAQRNMRSPRIGSPPRSEQAPRYNKGPKSEQRFNLKRAASNRLKKG